MYARRRRVYFAMMGVCLTLFVLAWAVVSMWSVPAAVAMCLVAMVIPPVAAVVANRKGPEDRWWDEQPPTPGSPDKLRPSGSRDLQSEEWWAELDGRKGRKRRR
ncbi:MULTISPECIES: DUF3099 domain-containing protein [Streptomyces]|uniref:DUF3099 domain-containing protein n=1 Tax=Streptomyces TaxID=1883 RepID=UPI00058BD108|nr:DUF3099 domain-containing protein [Streptomyces sp. SCSIO ZS0520]AYN34494.1 DUF3099 domain-containing protein [Streptomyces albus]